MSGHAPSDKLTALAKIAAMREDRAMRAWRTAIEARDMRASERTAAERAHEAATRRADGARQAAMADPCDPHVWAWTAVTRGTRDEAEARSGHAADALDAAVGVAERSRGEHNRSRSRFITIDDRLGLARHSERRIREDKEADDIPQRAPAKGPQA